MGNNKYIYDDFEESDALVNGAVERPKVFLPIGLLLLTFLTTTLSGAFFEGANPFIEPAHFFQGLSFSLPFLLILGTHELGHFFTARYHGVSTTLPLFIPGPPVPGLIGTFGAVIKIKSPITTRHALIDIGGAGPLSGFLMAIIVTIVGVKLSWLVPVPYPSGETINLGLPLAFHAIGYLVYGSIPEGFTIFLHPMAFAGWLGFFVTSINLLPLGQLDGGHMVYAVTSRYHRQISVAFVVILAILGLMSWPGWLIWAILVSIIGLRHPPTRDALFPIDVRRKAICWTNLLVFILTFTPAPFYIT